MSEHLNGGGTGRDDPARAGTRIEPAAFRPLSGTETGTQLRVRPATVLVALLFLICGAMAWFIFTARAVYLDTDPDTTAITIAGGMHLRLADRYLMRPGDYHVQVQAPGYYDREQYLVVGSDRNQTFSFQLERMPGHLQVETPGVAGAEILIDGQPEGNTPGVVRDLPPGRHQLRILAARYFPHEAEIEIEGLDQTQQLSIDLVPAWAEVRFATNPPGADVFVDDELLGQTPMTSDILEGRHDLRIKLGGYKAWQDEVRITANQPLTLEGITLEPADAVVFLVTNPPRASATVNGSYRGLTPLELELTPGRNTVSLFKQGYHSASRTITAKSGDRQRLAIDLQADVVAVEFRVTPADAILYIDNKQQAFANGTLQLSTTSHQIEIRRAGYVDHQGSITPRSGIAQRVEVSLKSLEQARQDQIKPVLTSSAGQTLKLFYPGTFTMGASRREPGRRPNETLREVRLTRPFYLSLHEVTNDQFRLMDKDHSSGSIQNTSLNVGSHPVVKVTWEEAAHYCNWLSDAESLDRFYQEKDGRITGINRSAPGYRLPTEAEWEWAARMAGVDAPLKFPWGPELPPPANSGNYADVSTTAFLGKIIENYQDGYTGTAPAGSFPPNPNGLYDMGGNVAEWVHDFYAIGGGDETDPTGPETGEFKVIRGSSWAHGTVSELRLSYRDYGNKVRDDLGFRIARYLD